MPTYRQIAKIHEDGYGEVIQLLTLSDTYAGLFATSGQIDVDVLDPDSTKRDLDIGANVLVESELTLTIDESAAETADDQAAVDFILAAQDETVKRYVALFIQPADVDAPAAAEMEYSGLVYPEMTAEDLLWAGARWGSSPDPLRRWSVTVKNFFEGVIDQFTMEELIYGAQAKGIGGIDNSNFRSNNLKYNHVAYDTGTWEVRWHALISLSALMAGLASELKDGLTAAGVGTFTITLEESPVGVKMAPAYFDATGPDSRYRDEAAPYEIDWSKEIEPRLGSTTGLHEFVIAWGNVEPGAVTSPAGVEGETEKEYSVLSCETFADFCYRLALGLGMYVRFEYTSATDLKISFTSRADVTRHEIWIPDVTKADLDTGPATDEDRKPVRGIAFSMAAEGSEETEGQCWYHFDTNRKLYFESERTKKHRQGEGDPLLFTMAPVMRRFGRVYDMPPSFTAACMPHNAFSQPGTLANETMNTQGITNALYINAGTSQTPHYLPAAALRVKIDGEDRIFYSLHEYVNAISGRDSIYYKTEYELTVPYSCSFRKSADGTHADDDGGRGRWQNLEAGCRITLDGITYAIIGFERKHRTLETVLRLHRLSRFSFAESVSSVSNVTPSAPARAHAPANTSQVSMQAGEAIRDGDAVTVRSDGKIYRAVALAQDFGKVFGIATRDAATGDWTDVQLPGGIVSCDDYSFTPGDRVYLRTVAYGNPNVTNSRLAGITATEDYFLDLGVAVSATAFQFTIGRGFIFSPGIPV